MLPCKIDLSVRLREKKFLNCLISVDGTDCRIDEPKPFSSCWYSHKFNGLGVRYEVGVTVQKGYICWINGPYPCGKSPDLSIYRSGLKNQIRYGEQVLTDGGYKDESCVLKDNLVGITKRYHSLIRARHETLNKRLKEFKVLKHVYRHRLSKHVICFYAVANITQIALEAD